MPTYHALPIDDYEAVNLLWLLRVAKRLGLDTGDWLGQLTHKLEARPCEMRDPNSGPRDTEMRLEEAARRILADQLLAATQEIERLTRERDEARAEWQGADGKADWYAKECERLRKLVGEACDYADGRNGKFRPHGLTWSDEERLAAIRHAAGVEGKGK